MTTMEQQIQALNVQLVASNVMGQAIDSLRKEPGAAISDLRRMLVEARAGNQPANKAREINFIDKKSFEGSQFVVADKESYKACSKAK